MTLYAHSYLFVPGDRPERFAKALAAGADRVIVDLEDAVAPSEKDGARNALAAWLSPERPVLVRINGVETPWFAADLELCRSAGLAGVLLPKAERTDVIASVADRLHRDAVLVLLIETARGIADARALARGPRVRRLAFGSLDFQLDLGIEGDGGELASFRSEIVLASRLASLEPPVDGVTTAIGDAARLREDTLQARRMGFGGKLCIHPSQVPIVNECFAPSEAEIAWAKRVLEAARASQGAAVKVDGRMVDRPVILKAEAIVREAQQQAAGTGRLEN
jgi:citrate lyase subunit beta/citryl-CoA lyase